MRLVRYSVLAMIIATAVSPVLAQTSTAPVPGAAGSARPARGPEQSSVPAAAPAASTTQPTASANPEPGVQQMNDEEKQRVQREGK